MVMESIYDEKEFEIRSDYIDDSDLEIWNVNNSHFDLIQRRLLGVGIKLLVGPRGTGKTHQMKIAHLKCIKKASLPLSIFVSFSKYYHLEPFLSKVPNALQIFHTWVLAKIIAGCYSLFSEENFTESEIISSFDPLLSLNTMEEFIEKAEKLRATQLVNDPLISFLSISKVVNIIDRLRTHFGRTRAILMLDDAALTFTPEYLIEFFDIVRSVKTKTISPKASVYPGTTQYGPRFHIGQDAEMVQCWLSIEDQTYSSFMDSLIQTRFAHYTQGINEDVLSLLKYASFGVPRAFITLLRNYKDDTEKNALTKFNAVIDRQSKLIESEYLSITEKLQQYKTIINTGNIFFKNIIDSIKEDNKLLQNERNIIIGVPADSISSYKLANRMIRFLIEAGLLYEETPVKHGVQAGTGDKREYRRYIPHFVFLFQNRTFSQGHGSSITSILSKIRAKARKHPLRRSISTLLSEQELENLKLDLPACQVCNTPRLSPEQKFCHNCGSVLVNQSAFEICMQISVDNLPLTNWQKEKVKSVGLLTIGDFLALQDPGTALKKIHRIGEVKSEKIYKEVIKTVDEFLV